MAASFPIGSGGFLVGANLPWIIYGCDFGRNAWYPSGGIAGNASQRQLADETFRRVAGRGVRSVRWFMLCDGRSGITFSDDGTPLGLDGGVFADLDAAVALARQHGLTLLFTLLDFLLLRPERVINGVQISGHRDVVCDERRRQALLDRVLAPILARYGNESTIAAWDIINEPEWATLGLGTSDHRAAVSRPAMRDFIGLVVDLVHRLTQQPATVGSASAGWLDLVRGLGLDFYQPHWYDHLGNVAALHLPLADFKLDRPALLGEFPTSNSRKRIDEILDIAHSAGYTGAFLWSVLSDDGASDYASAEMTLARWRASH